MYIANQLTRELNDEVRSQVIHSVYQLEKGGMNLELSGFSQQLWGYIVCNDNVTKDWVTRIVKDFTISGGFKLRTGSTDEYKRAIRIGVFFIGEKIPVFKETSNSKWQGPRCEHLYTDGNQGSE